MTTKRKRLPSLPQSVSTPLGPVPVERVDALQGEDGKECEDLGEVNYLLRVIRVRKKLALPVAWHTLEHEKVHLALWDAGVQLSHEVEERVCDVIATARVAEMVAQLAT